MASEDDAARLVDIASADELIEARGRAVQVGQLCAIVNGEHGLMDHTELPASNSELGFAGLVDFGADIV